MSLEDVIAKEPRRAFMMCNEAIVRGALEADVKLYAGYPGSPTSEILDAFYEIGEKMDMRVNISANEKVALETIAGAAMAGFRGITSMKSVGLNVASDSFFSLGYTGVKGGCVLVVADDPHAHSAVRAGRPGIFPRFIHPDAGALKRPAGGRLALLFQAHARWAREHLEEPAWPAELLAEAARLLGPWAQRPAASHPHRWRHARTDRSGEMAAPPLFRLPGGARLGLCGDRFAPGGGAEATYLSGLALARRILAEEDR